MSASTHALADKALRRKAASIDSRRDLVDDDARDSIATFSACPPPRSRCRTRPVRFSSTKRTSPDQAAQRI
jgi:hypothetical protein